MAERAAWDRKALRAEALDRMRTEGRASWDAPPEADPPAASSTSEPARPSSTLISQGGRSARPGPMPKTYNEVFRAALLAARGDRRIWKRLDV